MVRNEVSEGVFVMANISPETFRPAYRVSIVGILVIVRNILVTRDDKRKMLETIEACQELAYVDPTRFAWLVYHEFEICQ
jgi:hypothetical protein